MRDFYHPPRRCVPQNSAERDPMDSGLCCMARHANAVPPWTCDCPCHTRVEPDPLDDGDPDAPAITHVVGCFNHPDYVGDEFGECDCDSRAREDR